MKRTLIAVVAVLGFAVTANAATLGITTDQASYNVGDTIGLTVTGDAEGASTANIVVDFNYAPSQTSSGTFGGSTQLTSFGGAITWSVGAAEGTCDGASGAGACRAFDQIGGTSPVPIDQATVTSDWTFTALAPGEVTFDFGPATDFFGLTAEDGTAATVTVEAVPEPTTAAMLSLGLLGLGLAGRRRS